MDWQLIREWDKKELRDRIHDIVGDKCSAFVSREDCSRVDVCIAIEREIKEELDKLFYPNIKR